jgi:3-hydroxyisobutyrate dehydrogenase-like beta-hydroxyacid dehydrogenase
MAGHILSSGKWELWVHNRTPAKAEDLVKRGATAAAPQQMAAECDAVFLCLPTSIEVSEVTQHLLPFAREGLIIVDHSTIQPRVASRLAAQAAEGSVAFLDAPITGGQQGAEEGTLSIMVGGDTAALEAVRPVIEAFSGKVTYAGASGNGQMMKLANQILCGVNLLAVAEALSFAQENGLDLDKSLEALSGGAGDSWALRNLGPKMIAGDFQPGFTVGLQLKDLTYAIEAAQAGGSTLLAAAVSHQLCSALAAQGRGQEGVAAVYSVYKRLNGTAEGQ